MIRGKLVGWGPDIEWIDFAGMGRSSAAPVHNGLGWPVGLDLSSQIVLVTVMDFYKTADSSLACLCKLYKRNFG